MNMFDYYILIVSGMLVAFFNIKSYKNISYNIRISKRLSTLIYLLLASTIVVIDTYVIPPLETRAIVGFVSLLFLNILVFKEDIIETFMKSSICYVVILISEILLSVFLIIFKMDMELIDSNVLIKSALSILLGHISYKFCSFNIIKKATTKIIGLVKKEKSILILSLLSFMILSFSIYRFITDIRSTVFFSNLILSVMFVALMGITIRRYIINVKEVEKTEEVLRVLSKYEKIIEENRINRHEMLNNLLTLKSFENKSSGEYEEFLNKLIDGYNTTKNKTIKSIYKMPTGLKGIIYYKLKDAGEYGLNVTINISKQLTTFINEMDKNKYTVVCKVFAIIVDNAIEASKESNEKLLIIEMYENKKEVTIDIINSFNNKINMSKIYNAKYSTKGKNRGYGLFAAKRMMENDKSISLEQNVNNYSFISSIKIKK